MSSQQSPRRITTGVSNFLAVTNVAVQPADMPLDLEAQPCFALQSASRAITRAYKPLLEPLGLTYTQYTVLLALWEQDGLSLAELAARLHTDPPSLTPVIRRLAERGLLTRERAENDERRLIIELTEAGRALRTDAHEIPYQMLCRVGLDPQEGADLIALLTRIRSTLDAR